MVGFFVYLFASCIREMMSIGFILCGAVGGNGTSVCVP